MKKSFELSNRSKSHSRIPSDPEGHPQLSRALPGAERPREAALPPEASSRQSGLPGLQDAAGWPTL